MQPTVLFDLTTLLTFSQLRGIGRYVRGLVQGLVKVQAETELRVRGLVADAGLSGLTVVDDLAAYCKMPPGTPAPFAGARRSALLTFDLPGLLRRQGAVAHLSEPKGLPWSREAPYSVTCHDLIPLVLSDLYLPRIRGWTDFFAAITRFRYRQPRAILAVSNATRRDLCQYLKVEEERIEVVWHGVDHERFHPRPEVGEREKIAKLVGSSGGYVLYLGAGDPRKDLGTLLQAFARSRLVGDIPLVLAGYLEAERARELKQLAARLHVEREVKFLGYVPEALTPGLYRGAALHVFPSRYEGFGLPVLEALASGAPTITSPGSSLDEVAGDAALIVPCGEVEGMCDALQQLGYNSEYAALLRARGLARAATFTWEATARGTLAFWQRWFSEA
jgi:glycosyltransferase involved in cell wall biosynthesis